MKRSLVDICCGHISNRRIIPHFEQRPSGGDSGSTLALQVKHAL